MGESILGNRYEIIRKIGDGGMAFVYEAKDNLLNRVVALKVLRPEFVDDEEFLSKFKREAEAAASISHPNIVSVYDVGEDNKINYIVMEFIDGKNLKEIIKEEGTLDEYTALEITKQIARALGEAHKKGIIHRDIKPHNILISNEGRGVKVTDFGIAKAVSNSTMTNVGNIIGSVHYFSPEQAKGKFVTKNADLYSLGIILYELLIGKVPFRGDSPISIALQHINDDIEFTKEEEARIPISVRTIIKKLTEKSINLRYQTAEELIEDIEYIENNIDLEFIKEYSNYSTRKINQDTLNSIRNESEVSEDDDMYDEEYYEEETEKNQKSRNKLKIAIAILAVILVGQAVVFGNMIFGNLFGNNDSEANMVIMPDLTGMMLDEAQAKLEDMGLEVIIEEKNDDYVEEGQVISQTPIGGSTVDEGNTVTLFISIGKAQSSIPQLIGLYQSRAEDLIKERGFRLGSVTEEYSDQYEEGIVIKQSPESGNSNVSEGDAIDIVVSKGQDTSIEVPNILGLSLDKAEEALQSKGLQLGTIKYSNSDNYEANVVMMQTPTSGNGVEEGFRVDVVVSRGPEEEPEPPVEQPPVEEEPEPPVEQPPVEEEPEPPVEQPPVEEEPEIEEQPSVEEEPEVEEQPPVEEPAPTPEESEAPDVETGNVDNVEGSTQSEEQPTTD